LICRFFASGFLDVFSALFLIFGFYMNLSICFVLYSLFFALFRGFAFLLDVLPFFYACGIMSENIYRKENAL